MKFLLLLLLPLSVFSQNDSSFNFTDVVIVEGQTKDQLFTKGRQWCNKLFSNLNYVLRIADKESGELLGKCSIEAPFVYRALGKDNVLNQVYHLEFSIFVKADKYKYVFTNFVAVSETGFHDISMHRGKELPDAIKKNGRRKQVQEQMWQTMKEGLDKKMNELISSLKTAMTQQAQSDF